MATVAAQCNGSTAINSAAEQPEESPMAASYRQGELIKLMFLFGVVVGLIAFIYDSCMEISLEIVWKIIPEALVASAEKTAGGLEFLNKWGWMYTIIASTILGTLAGLSIKYLGFPGDLPNVIKCVHKLGYVPMKQTLPMIFVSLCSIAAGGSLGPEAPLVAISASVSGWMSMKYFKHDPVMVRKCTIIGMSAGLSAFFGVQLGGALFALEVLHTMGMQFFDVAVYAIGSGGMCLVVYRGLQGDTFGRIWDYANPPLSSATEVILASLVGVVAGGVGLVFRSFFRRVGKGVAAIGLGHFEDPPAPVILCALGGLSISILGVLVPPSMFWAEFEMESIADPSKELPHVWPPGGIFYGLEHYPWDSGRMYVLVGLAKLVAIAFTVQSGFRGGFIFPLFFAGASLGKGLMMLTDFLPDGLVHASPALMCMSFAAGLNVAVTRTPFASPLILATLSGAPNIAAPVLCASLASLFVTRAAKFIGPQTDRVDLRFIGDLQCLEKLPPSDDEPSDPPATAKVGKSEAQQNGFPPAEMSALLSAANGQNGEYSAVADASDVA